MFHVLAPVALRGRRHLRPLRHLHGASSGAEL